MDIQKRAKESIPFAKRAGPRTEMKPGAYSRFFGYMKYKKLPVLINLNVHALNVRKVGTIERSEELK